jgi:hypothetical protein
LEHPAATSLLPLARISKFFVVNYTPNTPVGSIKVNSSKSIKSKGNLVFPENQVTLGGYYRGHPPPPKNGPIFSQNSQMRQLRLNLSLRQVKVEREQPSGKDA